MSDWAEILAIGVVILSMFVATGAMYLARRHLRRDLDPRTAARQLRSDTFPPRDVLSPTGRRYYAVMLCATLTFLLACLALFYLSP